MKKVRIGVLGCGSMAGHHINCLGEIDGCQFTAASEVDAEKRDTVAKQYNVEAFDDSMALINSGLCDAVIIATPHYDHPVLSLAAMKKGLHVLTEKPVAVTAYAAAKANTAYQRMKNRPVYAAMFQQRTRPVWRKIKQLIDDNRIGRITRVSWIITTWFRTQAYYDSGGWRATWEGEGGGVLINQCPHNLDLIQWFCGMPERVTAIAGIGKYHRIEVEDDVTAILEYPNGATGTFVTSTGEAPGTNRLEITGDRGKIVSDGQSLELYETHQPVSQFLKSSSDGFGKVACDRMTIEVGGENPSHRGVIRNFVNAILHDEPLIAPAIEGIHGLELGNAMLMSGLLGEPVKIPTPRKKFDDMIKEMARKSKFRKPRPRRKTKADIGSSF
jgi:predicted dehydrogenase